MLNRRKTILAGAVLAGIPAVTNAATITYEYLTSTIKIATTEAGPYTAPTSGLLTGTGSAEVLTIPAGDYVEVGVDAEVTNNADGGLYSFALGFSDSNAAAAEVYGTGGVETSGTKLPSPGIPTAVYTGVSTSGLTDGAGGVQGNAGGAIAGAFGASIGATPTQASNAAGVFSPLFSKMVIATTTAGGTSVFTPIQVNSGTGIMETANKGTTTDYSTRGYSSATDTTAAMPTLTIVAVPSVTSSTGGVTGTNKIVSLVTSGAPIGVPPNGYGAAPAGPTLDVHNGTAVADTFAGVGLTTGYVSVVGENPASNTELYALQVDVNGVAATPSQVSTIVADINGSNSNASASALSSSPYATVFPAGYDILITTSAGSASPYFAWDFSNTLTDFTDSDTALGSVTVTGIAAVPEPASAVGILLGASGLLLGRRKSRLTVV